MDSFHSSHFTHTRIGRNTNLEDITRSTIIALKTDIEMLNKDDILVTVRSETLMNNYDSTIDQRISKLLVEESERFSNNPVVKQMEINRRIKHSDGDNTIEAREGLRNRYQDIQNNLHSHELMEAIDELNQVGLVLIHEALAKDSDEDITEYIMKYNRYTEVEKDLSDNLKESVFNLDREYNLGTSWKGMCAVLRGMAEKYSELTAEKYLTIYAHLYAGQFNYMRERKRIHKYRKIRRQLIRKHLNLNNKILVTTKAPTKKQLKQQAIRNAYAKSSL